MASWILGKYSAASPVLYVKVWSSVWSCWKVGPSRRYLGNAGRALINSFGFFTCRNELTFLRFWGLASFLSTTHILLSFLPWVESTHIPQQAQIPLSWSSNFHHHEPNKPLLKNIIQSQHPMPKRQLRQIKEIASKFSTARTRSLVQTQGFRQHK